MTNAKWLAGCLACLVLFAAWAEGAEGPPPRIRSVYIPAEELKVLFDSPTKGVLVPRDKVLTLWEEAQRRAPSQPAPPAGAVMPQASYEAQLADGELRMTGRIQIAVLQEGWQTIDLPFGGMAIESARLGGQPARLGRKDDGTLFLLLEKEGRFELELEMSAPMASKGGDLATTLKFPPVPASEMRVQLDKGKQLHVGETTLESEAGTDGRPQFRVAVGRGGLVPLVISERRGGGSRAPLVLVHSRSTGRIEPAGLRWEVVLELDVFARATESFRLQLPGSVDLAEVESPELGQWASQNQADGTATVALAFRKPVLGRRTVRLLGLAPVPSAAWWDFPAVKVSEAAAHVGQVRIGSAASLRVQWGDPAGIRPERLPPGVAKPSPADADAPLTFAFWDQGFKLPLLVTQRRRIVRASVATLVEVDRAGAVLRGSVTVQPRYAPVFDLQLQLPGDWDITSMQSGGKPVEWDSVAAGPAPAPGPAGRADAPPKTPPQPVPQAVRLDLAKPLAPGQSLEIAVTARHRADRWLEQDEGFQELPLPDLRLVGADEVEGTMLIQAPADIDLLAADISADLEAVPAAAPRGASAQAPGTALQYRYRDDAPKRGRFQVRVKPARVSVETLAYVRLDRGKLDVHYQADLHVRQGTVRQVRFTLPASAGEKIQVVPVDSPARIIEQGCSPVPDAGGKPPRNLWHVVLDRPLTGDWTLALDFGQTFSSSSPTPAGAAAGEPAAAEAGVRVPVPVLAFQNVSRQSGTVAVEAADDQQIGCVPEHLRELDTADVRKPRAYAPAHRIVAAYQYQRLPYRLALSATRHVSGSVLTGICESAEIISVAEDAGRLRHQARFRLRTPNLPHVPVTLPDGADLWSAMLDGKPVEVGRRQGAYLFPLTSGQAGAADAGRELTLLYETRGPGWEPSGLGGRLWPLDIRQAAPEIGVTTLATTWHVHAPDGADLVSSSGDFQPETPLTRPSLAAGLAETIARESHKGLPWKFAGLVAAVVVAGFSALVRPRKGGCSMSVVEVLVVVAIIGVLIALLLPATQSARESGRRATCMNNLKQIGLALLNYEASYKQFPPATIGPSNVPRERQFSWLVAILPFMEQSPLYGRLRLDLPCDHPHNAALLQIPLSNVLCPSDPSRTTQEGLCKTSYVAITGADSTRGSGSTRGVIGLDRGLRMDEIVDGTSNTLLVAEVADGGPWFAGGRGTARRIDDWIEKRSWSQHPGGGLFVFADGSVQFFTSTAEPQTLRDLATAQGLEQATVPASESAGRPAAAKELPPPPTATPPAQAAKTAEAKTPEQAPSPKADEKAAPPAKPAPQAKPSPPAPAESRAFDGKRARLSLGVALETRGGQAVRFRREGGPGALVLGIQNRAFAFALECFLVGTALLAAWLGRRMRGSRRATAVVLGLALPIALSGLVPLAWTPLLDGILVGSLAAGCLWIFPMILAAAKSPLGKPAAVATAIGLGLLSAADLSAAEKPGVAGKAPAPTVQQRPSDLTLFIPYDPEKGKPLEKAQVYMPHDQFLRLWKQAHPDTPERTPPDVPAVVSDAAYSGRLQGDVARFDGRLVVHHLVEGWTRVALPLGKVAFEKIEIDGQPAALAGEDQDQAAIYLEKPGPHVVDVRFGVPVSRLGATGQMTVPLRPVPSGRLLFELPQEQLDVQVSGTSWGWRRQLPAKGPEASKAAEVVSVSLGAGSDLSIRWQPRRVEARSGQLISADQALLVEVRDSGLHFHSKFHYRIQQGAVRELRLRIPPGLAVQTVQGPDVADWSIETTPAAGDRPAVEQLVVSLKTDRTAGTEVEVVAFRCDGLAAETVILDALEPLGVVHETGRVAIGCSPQFRVRVGKSGGLDQIDRAGLELPHQPGDDCPLLAAYRYTSRPWRLPLEVRRDRPRVEVSDRTAVAVRAGQAVLRSLLTAEVTGGAVRSLALRLPASFRVSQVQVPPGADWFVDRDDQGPRLRVELSGPAVGKLDLALSGTMARDPRQAEFVVPGVTVEPSAAQRGQLVVYLDDDLQAELIHDGGARSVDPAAIDAVLRPDAGVVSSKPATQQHLESPLPTANYAFQYDSPPKELRLRLSSAPSRASADVTTVVSVREGAVAYVSRVAFEVRQAARSRFRVETPDWLGDDVEVRGEQIRQVHSEAAGERRIWNVELQQPARGNYPLYLVQTLPLPGDGTVRAAVVRPLDVERSRGHIVLENATADEIAPTTTAGVTPVPTSALPEGLTDPVRRQAVAAYSVAGDAPVLTWRRRAREQESALTAAINMVDLTTVIHRDGRYRARAAYNIRNFTLQFLEIELPAGSQVWSAHVSGQPVRPATVLRDGRTITLLPLQKTSAGDFSSKVVVIYSGDLGEPLGRWAKVRPPAPQIVSPVPVSRTLWTLLLPRQYQVSLATGESNLEEVEAAYQQEERKLSFLDELQQILLVASSKGKSGARDKAQYNLKQVGVALDDYASQTAQAATKNAAEVQSQAQHIAAEVKRLEAMKTDGRRADDETFYFKPTQEAEGAGPAIELDRVLERLPEPYKPQDAQPAEKDSDKKSEEQAAVGRKERRGDLRNQAAEQLAKLQTAAPTEEAIAPGRPRPGEKAAGGEGPPRAQAAPGVASPAAETGRLSMDLDLALVGTPHHFSKLQGEPRLVVRAYHEDLRRGLTAMVWAGLCLTVAVAVIHGLRRPDALARAYRGWPWLAAVAGIAWLFLLPAGVLGLALLIVGLCTLLGRLRTKDA